ncbi:unnamed protein product [Adineta ricciae]|uniref:Tc1-like transposase DDE domain-containing protein n=1 Tax=Adineta ricciae TaxID=249248 RepID=A0A816FU60_ADIRI|nr:unnamed protein product [Adineta ricciae]
MAPKSKRQIQCANANKERWCEEYRSSDDDGLYCMEVGSEEEIFSYQLPIQERIQICDIANIFEVCANSTNTRYLSVLMYLTLRHFNISYGEVDAFLKHIGGLTAEVAHKWADIFMNGNFDEFICDGRGGKRGNSFYDVYPDIENEAKAFAVSQCEQKAASFTTLELAQFINEKYCKINNINENNFELIRSAESARLDLRRWGARFDTNANRPYFEGHDRADVVTHRQQFLQHFTSNASNYYYVSAGEDPQWHAPTTTTPTILICHDESTFRSGDVRSKRWLIDSSAPFFNKGQGRSVMISDFLVQHSSGPFFYLNEKEWTNATSRYPDLLDDTDLRYMKHSATVTAHLGVDPYFDNDIILQQFERLFKLLKFKIEYQNHKIEILVDNARTHTAKPFSINDFGKGIDTRCEVSEIVYMDEMNNRKTIDCFFKSGPYKGQSKGLLTIALELGFNVSPSTKLDEIKTLLLGHKAFQNISKLEQLALDYGFHVIFLPKFHCELNPIEGMWCHQKSFVRKYSDQTFPTLTRLIPESRQNFLEKKIFLKLFRRF